MAKEGEGNCNNSSGISSFILGIVGFVFSILIAPGIILGALGLIFGIVQTKKSKNKWATAGIILSVIAIIISLFVLWKMVLLVNGLQTLAEQCMADPTQPGCEAFAQAISQYGA